MSKNSVLKVLAFKLESGGYGVDATPTGTNGLRVFNLDFKPSGNVVKRNHADVQFGSDESVITQQYGVLTFSVELSGSGTPGDAPLYGSVLRVCKMLETITEDTKVEYTRVSTGTESGTAYFNWDGLLHKMKGARGNAVFNWPGGGLPSADITLWGLFSLASITDAAAIDVSDAITSFIPAIEVNEANTTGSVHGYNAVLNNLTLNLGNKLNFRDRPNNAAVVINDSPDCGGTIVFDAPSIASKNYFAQAGNNATGALALQHGTVAGNIIKLAADKLQFEVPSYTDIEGDLGISSNYGLVGRDDAFTLTVM